MNKANNTSWQRLESVISWANMTINHFGRHIGLARSEALYQIRAGQHGISKALAQRIVDKFPEVGMGWLLTGEGEMLPPAAQVKPTPFYEGDISNGIARLTESQPYCNIHLPMMEECDLAYRSTDEAMSPEVMAGTIVFLKRIGVEAIIPGGLYVIVCSNYVILRRVRVDEQTQGRVLRLEATNPTYDTITIGENQVVEIYRVVGNLKMY